MLVRRHDCRVGAFARSKRAPSIFRGARSLLKNAGAL